MVMEVTVSWFGWHCGYLSSGGDPVVCSSLRGQSVGEMRHHFVLVIKESIGTKSRLCTMDRTMDLIMDWTGLWQGLCLDYTGSYAYFHHQHRCQCLYSQCVGRHEIEPLVDSECICSRPTTPSCPQEIPTYNKQCTWLHDKEIGCEYLAQW